MSNMDLIKIRVNALIDLRKHQLVFETEHEWYEDIIYQYLLILEDDEWDLEDTYIDIEEQTSPAYKVMRKVGIVADVEQMAYDDINDIVYNTKKRFG